MLLVEPGSAAVSVTGRVLLQRGAALLINLIYLAVLGLIAAVVIETASFQFRMAGNFQLHEMALQAARSIALEVTQNHSFDTEAPVGYRVCAVAATSVDCDERTLPEPRMLDASGVEGAAYAVERRYPRAATMLVHRDSEIHVSSASHERFAIYEIDVMVGSPKHRLGQAHVVRGVALRLPSGAPQ